MTPNPLTPIANQTLFLSESDFDYTLYLGAIQATTLLNDSLQSVDNGTISPVIQTTNGSRVPSSRPRTDVRPSGKDTMLNVEHKVERKR